MILAVNDLPVNSSYGQPILPDFQIEKLTVFVIQADVIMQVTEGDQIPPAFNNPGQTELKMYQGFHSISPIHPWHAVRFKLLSGIVGQALVTLRAFSGETNF